MKINKKAIMAKKETLNKVKIHRLINFDKEASEPIKVSVVIPVCNVEQYLRQCIDSVINQTLHDIEIICVNDGSKDNSEQILEEYASKDTRVKVIFKENAGYGHTMNLGIDMAKGEYIGIVESDDYINPNMYEDLYNVAKSYDLDFIKSNFNRFIEENGEIKLFFNKTVPAVFQNRVLTPRKEVGVFRGVLNTWTGIYKKAFLEKFNIRHNETPGASYQDNGFFFQTFMFADRAYFSDKSYYMNRRDNPNSSVYSNAKMYCMRDEYNYIHNIMEENPEYSDKLEPIYWLKKFHNYLFTCDRLNNEDLKVFLKTFYNEFCEALNDHKLDLTVFNNDEREKILFLLNDPDGYYNSIKHGFIKISIIMPMFNEEKFLRKCLDSIFSQTEKDFELIVIDDGSTDKSLDIVNEYFDKYKNLKLLKQRNAGAGIARNKGIMNAQGEFICFMDADDWYPSTNILKNLYIAAKRNKVKICGGSFSTFVNNKIKTEYENEFVDYTFKENKLIKYSDYQFDYGYHRFIYDRQFIIDNNIVFPPYRRYQDPPFFVKAMITAETFYAISQVVYCYRKSDTKLTWTKEKLIDMLHGIKDNLAFAKTNNLAKLYYLNVGRINKDYLNTILSFIDPANKDVLLELFSIQSMIDEQLISEALHSKVQQFIIKPLWRAIFGNGKNQNIIRSNDEMLNRIYDVTLQIQSSINANINEKQGKLKRGFKYIKNNGIKCTIIRIFKGREAAFRYKNKKFIEHNK